MCARPPFNYISGIAGPNGTASFKYDALGRRIEKTINGVTTGYLYDGQQAIAELQGSTLGATYLTGLQIDEMLARYSSAGDKTYLTDALGSITAQTDATGAITQRYSYSAYGETQGNPQTTATDPNSVQYTGRENDGTGLYYYRARYYDPQLKRFTQNDPIGLNGGINEFGYVGGRPISRKDPKGLDGFDDLNQYVQLPGFAPNRPLPPDIIPVGSIGLTGTVGSTTVGVSTSSNDVSWGQTTQIGLGGAVEICVNIPKPTKPAEPECENPTFKPRLPDNYTFGLGKNLGAAINANGSVCIDVGPSVGLPAGVGWDLK